MGRTSTYLVAFLAAALLVVFIVVPLGAVFFKSIHVDGPLPARTMRAAVMEGLDRLPAAERPALMAGWQASLTDIQKMDTTAATLAAIGVPVTWDRKADYALQFAAAKTAVAALDAAQRAAFDAEFPIQAVVLHKRIPLAFKLRGQLSEGEFERLRTGASKGFSLENYRAFLDDPHLLRAGRNSLIVSTLTSLITVFLAYALAFGINRNGIRAPGLVRSLVLLPLVSPPVIMAFAAILLFGRQGLITKRLLEDALGWINADVTNIYGFVGVVTAMVLSYLPHAYIVLDDVLARHDGRVEEAAASQGATAWQVFRHVTLPLTRPGLIRAALVVFILSMTDFGNPLVIGRNYPVLAGVVYDEIVGFQNVSLAAALCVWLILPTLAAYFLFERIGHRGRFVSGAGTGAPPELPLPAAARLGLGNRGRRGRHRGCGLFRHHRRGLVHPRLGGGLHADADPLQRAFRTVRQLQRQHGHPHRVDQPQDRRAGLGVRWRLRGSRRLCGGTHHHPGTQPDRPDRAVARRGAGGAARGRLSDRLQPAVRPDRSVAGRHAGHPGSQRVVRQHLRRRGWRHGPPCSASTPVSTRRPRCWVPT